MSEQFPKAPDNQPTSSIETMLDNARRKAFNNDRHLRNAKDAVERAEKAIIPGKEAVRRLEWQLATRKAEEEVNGL